jgi:uncharacterized protein (AIM24 family)
MSVVIDGTTGVTAAAFDGAVDAADLTGTLPALNGSALTSLSAGNLTGDVAAARITTALNASGSAPIYACRAWVNFNGTGTVAIRASGNVSSITDNGAGNYTVNFTTAMEDENYAAVCNAMTGDGLSQVRFHGAGAKTTTSVKIYCTSDARAGADASFVDVAIFR